jgi:hypothetical protein
MQETLLLEGASQVVEVICSQFAFLRLCCHRLLPKSNGSARSKGRSPPTLYVFVHGLPWARRAKWHQPLLRSFAVMLAKHGIPTTMISGQLRVAPKKLQWFQVDIVAAREGRDY